MTVPEDVGRILDSERYKLAVSYLHTATAALQNALGALEDLPSGRPLSDAQDVDAARLVDAQRNIDDVTKLVDEWARRP